MEAWHLVLIAIGMGFVELFVSFFFNYKIYLITERKFFYAAILGSITTFMFIIMSGFIAYIASIEEVWWFILLSALTISIGNFFATILVPIVDKRVRAYRESKNPGIYQEENEKSNVSLLKRIEDLERQLDKPKKKKDDNTITSTKQSKSKPNETKSKPVQKKESNK